MEAGASSPGDVLFKHWMVEMLEEQRNDFLRGVFEVDMQNLRTVREGNLDQPKYPLISRHNGLLSAVLAFVYVLVRGAFCRSYSGLLIAGTRQFGAERYLVSNTNLSTNLIML